MKHLRLVIIAIAAMFVLALAAYALVGDPQMAAPADDDIIIKGGSLDVQCGKNHKTDNAGCLGLDDGANGKYKHKQQDKHITRVVVRNTNNNSTLFDSNTSANYNLGGKPEIIITYKK
jgi:hypothetical protein